jgi:catechol-2,3-dioxygenase
METPLRFDHFALRVADAAHARELFGEILGLPLVAAHSGDNWDGAPWLMMIYELPGGGQMALCALSGFAPPVPHATDLPHYAFAVPTVADLAHWRAKLERAGIAVRTEDHDGQQSLYFEDRGNITWEITAPPSRSERDAAAASVVNAWIASHGKARPT